MIQQLPLAAAAGDDAASFCVLLGSKGVGSGESKLGDLELTLSKIYPLPTLSLEGQNSIFSPTLSRSP